MDAQAFAAVVGSPPGGHAILPQPDSKHCKHVDRPPSRKSSLKAALQQSDGIQRRERPPSVPSTTPPPGSRNCRTPADDKLLSTSQPPELPTFKKSNSGTNLVGMDDSSQSSAPRMPLPRSMSSSSPVPLSFPTSTSTAWLRKILDSFPSPAEVGVDASENTQQIARSFEPVSAAVGQAHSRRSSFVLPKAPSSPPQHEESSPPASPAWRPDDAVFPMELEGLDMMLDSLEGRTTHLPRTVDKRLLDTLRRKRRESRKFDLDTPLSPSKRSSVGAEPFEDPEDKVWQETQQKFPVFRRAALELAYQTAKEMHKGQIRKTGDPYVVHCIETAVILAELGMEDEVLQAALLHDTTDDTLMTIDTLRAKFGFGVADLVGGVSKLSQITQLMRSRGESLDADERDRLNKMMLAMIRDGRVVLIKMADRLHNMRTAYALPLEKQINMAQDTLDVFAPLASRLGIQHMKAELEDLCFEILQPDEARALRVQLGNENESMAKVMGTMRALGAELEQSRIPHEISGRTKNLFSVYKKMQKKNYDLDRIYDLRAVRVLVGSIEDCYRVLDAVHALWTPLPTEFADYIRRPKKNNYQSLHTAVVLKDPQTGAETVVEVQIRTREMHQVAEYGVAAHWRYKENNTGRADFIDHKIKWLREMLAWRQRLVTFAVTREKVEAVDPRHVLPAAAAAVESPFTLPPVPDASEVGGLEYPTQESVVIITAKGDILELATGSSAFDAASIMGAAEGNSTGRRYCGVRVNGELVTLDHRVKDGDLLELAVCSGEKEEEAASPCGCSERPPCVKSGVEPAGAKSSSLCRALARMKEFGFA
eukprot:tig00000382_g24557.t1